MRRVGSHQPWDDASEGRVRVLLECDADAAPSIIASVIERKGYEVRTCEGPESRPCNLLHQGMCSLVDGADVVVNMLHAPGEAQQVLGALTTIRRPPAIVAEQPLRARRGAPLEDHAVSAVDPDQVTVIEGPLTSEALIAGIEAAVTRTSPAVGSPDGT